MELSAYILPDIFNLWDCRNRIIERMDFVFDLGQFTRNYTQTVKRAADNK